jgi:hypothetical protein
MITKREAPKKYGWRLIVNKFENKCSQCGQVVKIGEEVYWNYTKKKLIVHAIDCRLDTFERKQEVKHKVIVPKKSDTYTKFKLKKGKALCVRCNKMIAIGTTVIRHKQTQQIIHEEDCTIMNVGIEHDPMSVIPLKIELLKDPNYHGWTRDALAELGVHWPPEKGWKSKLIAEYYSKKLDEEFATWRKTNA